jgi:hypothetical protein
MDQRKVERRDEAIDCARAEIIQDRVRSRPIAGRAAGLS